MSKDQVIKIKPYPIKISLLKAEGAPPLSAEILRLTDFGFIMSSVSGHLYRTGETYLGSFELPAVHEQISQRVKVIKTYQEIAQGTAIMVEMHFKELPKESKKLIQEFLHLIRQKSQGGKS